MVPVISSISTLARFVPGDRGGNEPDPPPFSAADVVES